MTIYVWPTESVTATISGGALEATQLLVKTAVESIALEDFATEATQILNNALLSTIDANTNGIYSYQDNMNTQLNTIALDTAAIAVTNATIDTTLSTLVVPPLDSISASCSDYLFYLESIYLVTGVKDVTTPKIIAGNLINGSGGAAYLVTGLGVDTSYLTIFDTTGKAIGIYDDNPATTGQLKAISGPGCDTSIPCKILTGKNIYIRSMETTGGTVNDYYIINFIG